MAKIVTVDTAADLSPGNAATACAAGNGDLCSLRAAIDVANVSGNGVDEISIPSGMHITLTAGVLDLDNSVIIDAAGATINGGGTQILHENTSSAAVQVNGVELTGGTATAGGAVELDSGSLVLSHVDVTGNDATEVGGGLYDGDGSLWIDHSTFTDNAAGSGGGAMFFDGGAQQVEHTTVGGSSAGMGNAAPDGAGIYNGDGDTVINDSVLDHNTSGSATYGTGVGLYTDSVTDLIGSIVDDNTATAGGEGAGVFDEYELHASGDAIDDNSITGSGDAYGAGFAAEGEVDSLLNVTVDGNINAVSGSNDIYGGGAYLDDDALSWSGGTIDGTVNGDAPSSDDYIGGGALYSDCDNATITDVDISATTNAAGTEDVYGGAFYNDYNTTLQASRITGTSSTGSAIAGGEVYADGYTDLSRDHISATSAHGTSTSGGAVYGGLFYNDDKMIITNLVATGTTDIADLATASTPSDTPAYIYGGAVENEDEFSADGMSIKNTTADATGGNSYVEGGGFYNDDDGLLDNTQLVGVNVTADDAVTGGLFVNYDTLSADHLTLGGGVVSVVGGPDAPAPYAQGSILYSDDPLNLIDGTLADDAAYVAGTGDYNYGVEIADDEGEQFTSTTIANDDMVGPSGATNLLRVDNGANLALTDTIVSSNQPALNCSIGEAGSLTSSGDNLDNGDSCGFTHPGDLQNANPEIAPLADNGGAVDTAALYANSPAIRRGGASGCAASDARGTIRPRSAPCDIGSYYVSPRLTGGEILRPGMDLVSSNGEYRLVLQPTDGNLVLRNAANKALWAAGTQKHRGDRLVMQAGDGNLVVYNAAGSPIWASGTTNHPADQLVVQSDGRLVLYSATNKTLWESRT